MINMLQCDRFFGAIAFLVQSLFWCNHFFGAIAFFVQSRIHQYGDVIAIAQKIDYNTNTKLFDSSDYQQIFEVTQILWRINNINLCDSKVRFVV